MKCICPCGYECVPALGDPGNGIAPGTACEDVFEDFVCPLCVFDKDAFDKEDRFCSIKTVAPPSSF